MRGRVWPIVQVQLQMRQWEMLSKLDVQFSGPKMSIFDDLHRNVSKWGRMYIWGLYQGVVLQEILDNCAQADLSVRHDQRRNLPWRKWMYRR